MSELDKKPSGSDPAGQVAIATSTVSSPGKGPLTAGAPARTTADLGAGAPPVRVTADQLNVRSTPQVERGNVLGGLRHGAVLKPKDESGSWLKILFRGTDAFVNTEFVEPVSAAAAAAAEPAHEATHVEEQPAEAAVRAATPASPAAAPSSASQQPTPAPPREGQFATASGNAIDNTSEGEATVLNQLRKEPRRFDPAWLLVAQRNLNVVDATGVMNTETLRAMREHAHKPKLDPAGIMDETFLTSIAPGTPFYAGTEDGFMKQDAKPGAKHPADLAAQAVGYASYEAYKADWVPIKFLGQNLGPPNGGGSGRGHPYLAARIAAAEAYLRQRHPSPDGDEGVIKAIGWNKKGVAAYDDDLQSMSSHQHTMGLAIDIDPAHNPYIFNEHVVGLTHEQAMWWIDTFKTMFKTATKIYGGDPIAPETMMEWSRKSSTEELFQKISATSKAFEQYLALSKKKPQEILATLKRAGYSDSDAVTELPSIQKAEGLFKNGGGREYAKSITNISQELLTALRDVAGLSWGGSEMSERENGDFMHFDCRGTSFGYAVYSKKAPTAPKA